jgi:arylsulfatase A-like enzyme
MAGTKQLARGYLSVATCVAVGLIAASPPRQVRAAESTQHPNVVIVLSDDQGWGDLSVNGNSNVHTPNIDSLARDGAIFDRFFVCPVCSPTRAEFLTGRYHPRCGVWSTSAGGERLNLDETTIAQVFRRAGYATGAFGKWHNGTQWPYHPRARGFDEFYGFCSGHWGQYFDPVLEHNGKTVRGKGFIADDLTDHAIEFIEQHQAGPFFCYLPFNTPHSPLQVPDPFYEKFKNAELKLRYGGPQEENPAATRAVLAMCENIDWNVGRVLAKLDALKIARNTIVLYFCDNGPNGWRWNGGMKGHKASTDEGGVRSPLLVRWPERIKPGTKVAPITAAIDLLPTLAELCSVELTPRADKPLDGRSLAPQLLGKPESWTDRMIFSHWAGKVSVRTQQHRLDSTGKLFDMTNDPGQASDRSAAEPQTLVRLSRAAADWERDCLTSLARDGDDKRPFTVGYREFPITQLPARDGKPHGSIRRSARAPNCSYFENWTGLDDRITWNVEVHTSGKYEATVLYTCREADVGSTIELSFGNGKIQAVVSKAHDPQQVGAEDDRVPRLGESYVKDFAPLAMGTFELKARRGELTLRALAMPGKQVMDVRGVTLTLIP